MTEDQVMQAVICVTVGAFCGFIVHLMFCGDDDPKRRK